jgi:hypothetical protein
MASERRRLGRRERGGAGEVNLRESAEADIFYFKELARTGKANIPAMRQCGFAVPPMPQCGSAVPAML